MNEQLKQYVARFDAQTLRERGLIAFSIIVAMSFVWWVYFAEPSMKRIERLQASNQQMQTENNTTRATISEVRQRLASGVHQEKESQLRRLLEQLASVEDRLRVETVELIDPDKMFQLMNELIYRDSKLRLLGLKRREVRPAIPLAEGEEETREPGIYRHVLELEYAGKYLDILQYMRALEALDWKLLWDEIEIVSEEYPGVTVKVVISTLSTQKEWVGI